MLEFLAREAGVLELPRDEIDVVDPEGDVGVEALEGALVEDLGAGGTVLGLDFVGEVLLPELLLLLGVVLDGVGDLVLEDGALGDFLEGLGGDHDAHVLHEGLAVAAERECGYRELGPCSSFLSQHCQRWFTTTGPVSTSIAGNKGGGRERKGGTILRKLREQQREGKECVERGEDVNRRLYLPSCLCSSR